MKHRSERLDVTKHFIKRHALHCCRLMALRRFVECQQEDSGRCHRGPVRHAGKCFCLHWSSFSGSWVLEEQHSPVSNRPSSTLLSLPQSISSFGHWPVSRRRPDGCDGGFTVEPKTVQHPLMS